jgi:hypothetical protein
MRNEKSWARRVKAWRRSGLSSIAFAEGKDFTGGGLRHMAHRLRKASAKAPVFRLARVVRARAPAVASAGATIVVVVGEAKIEVHPGASRDVLTMVFEALANRSAE